jgi:hypothetical protein
VLDITSLADTIVLQLLHSTYSFNNKNLIYSFVCLMVGWLVTLINVKNARLEKFSIRSPDIFTRLYVNTYHLQVNR